MTQILPAVVRRIEPEPVGIVARQRRGRERHVVRQGEVMHQPEGEDEIGRTALGERLVGGRAVVARDPALQA